MAYDEGLAERIRLLWRERRDVEEKRMFGGLCFLVGGHMVAGIVGEELMLRVGPAAYEATLLEPHVREMDFTKRPLKGFVYIEPAGFDEDDALERWLSQGLAFQQTLPPRETTSGARAKAGRARAKAQVVDVTKAKAHDRKPRA
ncbi:MAG: TfoX/Sxy family protein [Myxococcota bacterium]